MASLNENNDVLEKPWLSEEEHFQVTGYVKKQNHRYYADNNPNKVHFKVTRCAVFSKCLSHYNFFVREDQNSHFGLVVQTLKSFVAPALENRRLTSKGWCHAMNWICSTVL